MAGTGGEVVDRKHLIEHLEAALDAEESAEVDFHLRHALQLLKLQERVDGTGEDGGSHDQGRG